MIPKFMWVLLIGALAFFLVGAACVLVITFLPNLGAANLAAAYATYREAIQNEDIPALQDLVASDKRDEMLGEGAEMKLKIIKQMMPAEYTVKSQKVSGEKGRLELESFDQGQKMSGTIDFVKEADSWRIVKEHWSITITGGFAGDAAPLFTGGSKPPQPHVVMQEHQGAVTRLAFSPDGQFLVSISYDDYTLRSWEPVTGTQISSVKCDKRPTDLAITPDGRTILTADVYKNITAWTFAAGEISNARTIISDAGDAMALSKDGTLIAATAFNHPIGIWWTKGGKLVQKLHEGKDQRVLCFDPSNKNLVSGGGNTYSVWSGAKWKEDRRTIAKVSGDMFGLDVSLDGKTLATAHGDSSIVIFDLPERKERRNFFVKDAATLAAKISPDGGILATANRKEIYLWDAQTGKQKAKLTAHDNDVECLAFGPGGATLASGSRDRKIILWRGGPPPAAAGPVGKAAAAVPDIKPGKVLAFADHKNLVTNPSANERLKAWQTDGDATVEPDSKNNPHFSIKYKGTLRQDIDIRGFMDRFAVIIARTASSRKNTENDQTGYPYLYGYWVHVSDPNRFNGYLQGQHMLFTPTAADRWGIAYGVFKIPPDTGAIRLFLQQADGKSAQNGSAARFDDVGIYIFGDEPTADRFVKSYEAQAKLF